MVAVFPPRAFACSREVMSQFHHSAAFSNLQLGHLDLRRRCVLCVCGGEGGSWIGCVLSGGVAVVALWFDSAVI